MTLPAAERVAFLHGEKGGSSAAPTQIPVLPTCQHRACALTDPTHDVKQPISFPRRVFCARVLLLASLPPYKGVAERRETYGCSDTRGPALNAAGQAPARRLASHNAGRPPLGALTVAILGSGPALPSPDLRPDRLQRAPRVRVVVPGWRGPVPPGTAVPEPLPQDATPRSAFRMSPDDALR